jgi:hypothetical protein
MSDNFITACSQYHHVHILTAGAFVDAVLAFVAIRQYQHCLSFTVLKRIAGRQRSIKHLIGMQGHREVRHTRQAGIGIIICMTGKGTR